jgi:hypothetical protein
MRHARWEEMKIFVDKKMWAMTQQFRDSALLEEFNTVYDLRATIKFVKLLANLIKFVSRIFLYLLVHFAGPVMSDEKRLND